MSVVVVDCSTGQEGQRRPVEVTVPRGDPGLVLYDLRRSVSELLQCDPSLIRLAPSSSSRIEVPQRISCTVLDPKSLTMKITVCEFQSRPQQLSVHTNDTLIDVKFILAQKSRLPAESHILAPIKQSALPDSTLVTPGMVLQLWYEIRSSEKGRGASHRSRVQLLNYPDPSQSTLQLLLRSAMGTYASLRLMGTRKWNDEHTVRGNIYTWQTYQTVDSRCRNLAAGLKHLGIQSGDKIGIMANNRPEWAITDFTCMLYGLVSVTIYDTLGPDVVEYIVNHADVKAIVVSKSMLPEVIKVRGRCPKLSLVVMMDDLLVEKKNTDLKFDYRFSEVEELGKQHVSRSDVSVKPSDVASICYTSGTTGNPKGALLTHANLVAATAALSEFSAGAEVVPGVDSIISYLPLAHIYERLGHLFSVFRGVGIGYFSGDTSLLVDDVAILKPSIFPGVPRVWQRIYDKIHSQINDSSFVTKKLFQTAYESKIVSLKSGNPNPDSGVLDHLVFKSIAGKFGGNLKLMISGSAPISGRISSFMRICMRAPLMEGYGLTETCALTSLTPLDDFEYGQVGVPVSCSEIMLVDVPSMSYLTTDKPCSRGEIWIRGPNIFAGYHKQPETTAECITSDGWFKTGDIGKWRSDGRLQIIDRVKNIFKLAQGEYIRPDHIECIYKMSPFIANMFVYGDSTQSYLVAIIVPNQENVAKFCAQHNIDTKANNPKAIYQVIEKDMKTYAEKEGLRGFEQVRKFTLTSEDFTVENGLLTPSLKLKRHEAKLKFHSEIETLYRSNGSLPSKL